MHIYRGALRLTSHSNSVKPVVQLLEREDVLSELQGYAHALEQGNGHVVSFSGEAGIGKTSVLRAFVQSASEQFLVLQSGCEDLTTPRPLGPLFDIAEMLDPNLTDMLADDQQKGKVLNHLLIASGNQIQGVFARRGLRNEPIFDLRSILQR